MNTKEKIILGLAGALLIAGVALAGTGVISLNNKTATVFQDMANASASVTSSHIDLSVTGDFSGSQGTGPTHFAAKMSGVASKTATSQSSDLHFSATGSPAGSSELSVEGDFRILDRIFYLRATKLPPVPFFQPGTVMNKWFSIDPISMYKQFGDADKAAEFEQALSVNTKMPKEFIQKSYALAVQEGVVSKIDAKNNEVISGVTTQKYDLTINPEKIPSYLVKYTELYNSYATQAGLSQIPEKAITEEDKKLFSTLKFSTVSVWIGNADKLPYKIAFTLTMNSIAPEGSSADSISGTLSFEAVMSDYNKVVSVEKPTSVTPIQDLFKSLMGSL